MERLSREITNGVVPSPAALPAILFWNIEVDGKEVEYYHNCLTGEGSLNKESITHGGSYCYIYKKGNFSHAHAMEYLPEYDVLAISCLRINTTPISNNEKRDWETVSVFYFNREKDCVYFNKENNILSKKRNCCGFKKLIALHNTMDGKGESHINEDIYKIFPKYIRTASNLQKKLEPNINSLLKFLSYKEPIARTGRKQSKIDYLNSITPELVVDKQEIIKVRESHTAVQEKFAVLEKIPAAESTTVLRTFSYIDDIVVEGSRIYFDSVEAVCCKFNNLQECVVTPIFHNTQSWDYYLLSYNKDICNGTVLEYIQSILNDFSDFKKGYAIWTFTKWPVFESLYKAGYKEIVKYSIGGLDSLDNLYLNPISALESLVGKINSKEKKLFPMLGMNKYQLSVLEHKIKRFNQNIDENNTSNESYDRIVLEQIILDLQITYLKYIFSSEPISRNKYHSTNNEYVSIAHLDNHTTDTLLGIESTIKNVLNELEETMYFTSKFLSPGNFFVAGNLNTLDIRRIAKKLYKGHGIQAVVSMQHILAEMSFLLGGSREDIAYMDAYYDYLDMLEKTSHQTGMKYKFSSLDDLLFKHDNILRAYNLNQEHFKQQMFDNRIPVWKDFEYSNDVYSVVAPTGPLDIVKEGSFLKHCAKSYIDDVISGQTNILFIRKNNEIKKPFFTVEVSNSKKIQQVHGFGNRKISTEDGLPAFIDEWSKKIQLKKALFYKVDTMILQ